MLELPPPPHSAPHHPACAPERIGVRRIRLFHPRLQSRVVLGSFVSVDKQLYAWASAGGGLLACEFEIVYLDGRSIGGSYQFRRKGTSRPFLMRYIRSVLEAGNSSALFGIGGSPDMFLQQYDTDDF